MYERVFKYVLSTQRDNILYKTDKKRKPGELTSHTLNLS